MCSLIRKHGYGFLEEKNKLCKELAKAFDQNFKKYITEKCGHFVDCFIFTMKAMDYLQTFNNILNSLHPPIYRIPNGN